MIIFHNNFTKCAKEALLLDKAGGRQPFYGNILKMAQNQH